MLDELIDSTKGVLDDSLGFVKEGVGLLKDGMNSASSGRTQGLSSHTASILKNGLSRTNRFQVIIALPQKIVEDTEKNAEKSSQLAQWFGEAVKIVKIFSGKGSADYTRGLDLMCAQTSLPGKTINVSETKYNGDTLKSGHSILYGQHQFTFKVSTDMYEKDIIDNWMNLVVDPTTHEVGYHSDYATNIIINQLNTNDKVVKSYMLEDAWPVNVNELVLSHLESNNTHELMVQFAYRRWKDLDLDSTGNGLLDKLSQTPFGPYLAPILSNPAVQKGLEYLKDSTGLDLEGEAVNIYNQVDKIVRETTGESIGNAVSLLNGIKANLDLTENISPEQIVKLSEIIDGTIGKIKE